MLAVVVVDVVNTIAAYCSHLLNHPHRQFQHHQQRRRRQPSRAVSATQTLWSSAAQSAFYCCCLCTPWCATWSRHISTQSRTDGMAGILCRRQLCQTGAGQRLLPVTTTFVSHSLRQLEDVSCSIKLSYVGCYVMTVEVYMIVTDFMSVAGKKTVTC